MVHYSHSALYIVPPCDVCKYSLRVIIGHPDTRPSYHCGDQSSIKQINLTHVNVNKVKPKNHCHNTLF